MPLTYTWKLKSLKKTNTTEFSDLVIQTYWECTGTDEDGDSGTFSGATPFDPQDVNGDGFINYEDLTEAIVLSWIQSTVAGSYKEHIDYQIMKQINEKKMPIVEVTENQLPWAPPASETTTTP